MRVVISCTTYTNIARYMQVIIILDVVFPD